MGNSKMMWAYLIHLADNMWGDEGGAAVMSPYQPKLLVNDTVWRQVIDFLPAQGFNTVVIDVGDAVQYESHPEISIQGAWSKDKLKAELDHIREIGLTPIPKLNFSAGHDAWLGIYGRMLSTPIYYEVCKDLITEVAELFGYPEYFHLGMDEETAMNQGSMLMATIRQHDLLWHDLYFYFDCCEKVGARPWIWSDMCWNERLLPVFLKKMPKSVLQSNWHYYMFPRSEDGTYKDKETRTYCILDEAGFEQVPTGSTIYGRDDSMLWTMQEMKKELQAERIKGYMTAPWIGTTEASIYRLLNDAVRFRVAKEQEYPEECK